MGKPLIFAAEQNSEEHKNVAARMACHSAARPAYAANGRIAGRSQVQAVMVLDRIDGDDVVIESEKGTFRIPSHVLPEEMLVEGAVLELKWNVQEAEERLAKGQARIERMQVITL